MTHATPGQDVLPKTTFDRRSTNLPVQPTRLIDRVQEVAAVCALLRRADVRLVTLTGPGGTGKTRLGLKVAAELLGTQQSQHEIADGVYFVNLASLNHSALVVPAIAQTLGVKPIGEQPLAQSLADYLHVKRLLLLLDNFERVRAAARDIAMLLNAAPGLKVLATSRAALRLADEHEFAVPPLAVPPRTSLSGHTTKRAEFSQAMVFEEPLSAFVEYPAVELFVERALTVRPDLVVTSVHASAVAEICLRLDGLPLAIELAAARSKLLSPSALLARLERRLPLLTGGARDAPVRQQTLRNTIAWSYDLLAEEEQVLFARLGVFVGGCTVGAAEAICKDWQLHEDQMIVLDHLEELLDQNLLRRISGSDGEPRLMMLDTIHEYALERLTEREEATAIRQRHAQFFLALAESAEPQLRGPDQHAWLNRLEDEHANLRAALEWAISTGDVVLSMRLAGALGWFWFVHSHYAEGQHWLQAVGTTNVQAPTGLRAKISSAVGTLAYAQGDIDQAVACHEQALALYHEIADHGGAAFALNNLGAQALQHGDLLRAGKCLTEGLTLAQSIGDKWLIAVVLGNLGLLAREQGDDDGAAARYQESLALCQTLGDQWIIEAVLHNLGEVVQDQGDHRRAVELYKQSLALSQEWGNRFISAHTLQKLGQVMQAQGDRAHAAVFYQESLALFQDIGFKRGIAEGLEGLAALACAATAYQLAARLYGAAEVVREAGGTPIWPADRPGYDHAVAAVRTQLETALFASAWAEGRAMHPEQALAATNALFQPYSSQVQAVPKTPQADPFNLTEREIEVLRLLVRGLTYAQIAEHLVISPRTVNRHLTSIYGKLGVSSRHAATRFATEQHLVD